MRFEILGYCLLLIFACVICFLPVGSDNIEKIKYCKIDSIYTLPKYEFTSEKITKYHTECDVIFSSKHIYIVGDSIEVKTIIIQ
jgi:hypothetical protein